MPSSHMVLSKDLHNIVPGCVKLIFLYPSRTLTVLILSKDYYVYSHDSTYSC